MKISHRIVGMLLALVLCIGALPMGALAAGDIMYGIGFVDASSLRLRSEPNYSSKTVDMAYDKECVVVISKSGEWYKVNYNLQVGYMHQEYVDVLTQENAELGYGEIIASSVNMRSGPSTSYLRTAVGNRGDKCYILGLNQGWYKVIYGNKICYIRSDYVKLTEFPYENRDSSHSPKFYRLGKSTGIAPSAAALNGSASGSTSDTGSKAPDVTGSQILNEARKYLGTPYVNGGASPAGFDCSGFVYYVLKTLGFSPYRTPADQYKHGSFVDKANLQVGDIVFFANTYGSGISHVGIYAGNGQFIHSPNSRSTVSYSDLTTGYWAQHYYGARRVA